MQCTLCFAARHVVRDARSNNISAFFILEEFRVEGLPAFVPELSILAVWFREATDPERIELEFRARINDRRLSTLAVVVQFASEAPARHRSIVALANTVLMEPGTLHFEFLRQETVIASYSIPVLSRQPQAATLDEGRAAPNADAPIVN